MFFFFFQAEDGIRDLVRSRGLGDVYKRQVQGVIGLAKAFRREVIAEGVETLEHGEVLLALGLSLIHI